MNQTFSLTYEKYTNLLKEKEDTLQLCNCKQNRYGIDMIEKDAKLLSNGQIQIIFLSITNLPLEETSNLPFYITCNIVQKQATEKVATSFFQTEELVAPNSTIYHLEFIKKKLIDLKFSIYHKMEYMADQCVDFGICPLERYLDQKPHQICLCLQNGTTLMFELEFLYSIKDRLQAEINELTDKITSLETYAKEFTNYAAMLQPAQMHPASYGLKRENLCLYLPGTRFNPLAHHYGSILQLPLPEMTSVETPFGNGQIQSFRESRRIYLIRLFPKGEHQFKTKELRKNALLAYIHEKHVKAMKEPKYQIGQTVSTMYGDGKIQMIRPKDQIYELVFTDGKTGYFHETELLKAKQKPLAVSLMPNSELLNIATEKTNQGNEYFQKKNLSTAIEYYNSALYHLQALKQDELTNRQRGNALQLMIRDYLNMGQCYLSLKEYRFVETSCTSAIEILEKLQEVQDSLVIEWMVRLGYSIDTIFKDWICKAYFRRSQSYMKRYEYTLAKNDLLNALKYVRQDGKEKGRIETNLKIIQEWLRKERRKEKKTWSKIFEERSSNEKKVEYVRSEKAAIAPKTPEPEPNDEPSSSKSAQVVPLETTENFPSKPTKKERSKGYKEWIAPTAVLLGCALTASVVMLRRH